MNLPEFQPEEIEIKKTRRKTHFLPSNVRNFH